ncbi:hypothetical protein D1867_02580 [Acidianus infernus]|uniref:Uncharacterized protein n=1 Tax=Acidianus infernus TaxID=12915 RepID=A0A6A9QCW2_ACIIN|nr:hypothetical protein [Acidianus infernus]MUM64155.1 hypothetical protein [Acidianus infernus]
MSAKRQVLSKNEISLKMSKLYELLTIAEDAHEILGYPPTTDFNFIYVKKKTEELSEYDLIKEGNAPYEYRQLYEKIKELYMEFLVKVMANYADETMRTQIEYINFVLKSGEYVIFEGDIDKVTMPMPSGIASVHTHPGICIFSAPDIETADSLFVKGYVVIAVMNNECISYFLRKGPYTPEDQQELRKLQKKVKKAKTFDELKEGYTSFNSENVIFRTPLFS